MSCGLDKKIIADIIGTFFLVFIGTGSAVAATLLVYSVNKTYGLGMIGGFGEWLGVSLAFGITVLIMIYAVGKISGAHFNPAVTIGLLVTGNIPLKDAIAYIIAQCIGATLGSFCVFYCYGPAAASVAALGATAPAVGVGMGPAILAELLGTFALVFVVMGVAVDKKADPGMAGIAIGLTVAAAIFVLGPITGGSINPARTFGPYLVNTIVGGPKLWGSFIIYLVGPVVGVILGALVYKYLAKDSDVCELPAPFKEE